MYGNSNFLLVLLVIGTSLVVVNPQQYVVHFVCTNPANTMFVSASKWSLQPARNASKLCNGTSVITLAQSTQPCLQTYLSHIANYTTGPQTVWVDSTVTPCYPPMSTCPAIARVICSGPITVGVKECPEQSIANGLAVTPSGRYYPSSVIFSCNAGYALTGDTVRDCNPIAVWTGSKPTCNVKTCPMLTSIDRISVIPPSRQRDTYDYNTVVRYKVTCNSGRSVDGQTHATIESKCREDRTWSVPAPLCQDVTCSAPQTSHNFMMSSQTAYQQFKTFTCRTGYSFGKNRASQDVTTFRSKCTWQDSWSPGIPYCSILRCGEPGRVVNGDTAWDGAAYQDQVFWTCNPGYARVGSGTAVCQSDGQWSGQPPTCGVSCYETLPADFRLTSPLVSSSFPVPDCGKTAADIIVVVDESDSITPAPKEWLHLIMQRLERSLQEHAVGLSAGLPNQYTLVGFGRLYFQTDMGPYSKPHVMTSNDGSKVYDVNGFAEACQGLGAVGSIEDGYLGMKYALENITDGAGTQLLRLRQDNVAPIVILITDEDRDVHAQNGAGITRSSIKRTIRRSGATMEAIVDNSFLHNQESGFGMDAAGMLYSTSHGDGNFSTKYPGRQYKRYLRHSFRNTGSDYTSVALELGGAAWDLKGLFVGGALDPAVVNAVVDRTVTLVTQRVHKCCSCSCGAVAGRSGRYLRCSSAPSVDRCELSPPFNRFRG